MVYFIHESHKSRTIWIPSILSYFYAVFEHFCERSTEKKSHETPILNYLRLDTLINFKIIFSLQLGFSGTLIAGSAMYKYFKNKICVKNREAQTFISIDT